MKDNSNNKILDFSNILQNNLKYSNSLLFNSGLTMNLINSIHKIREKETNRRLLERIETKTNIANNLSITLPNLKLMPTSDTTRRQLECMRTNNSIKYNRVFKSDVYNQDRTVADKTPYIDKPNNSIFGLNVGNSGILNFSPPSITSPSSGPFFGPLSSPLSGIFYPPSIPRLTSPIQKEYIEIKVEINSIEDILKIIEEHPYKLGCEYNINLKALHDIKEPMEELNAMIGMKSLKENIVDQILFYIQNLHTGSNDFMHTCIYGPPGTGKTEIAKIMGKVFSNLGVLKNKSFQKVTRSDLIAGYLGQTAIKTQDVVKKALGGVLFIDEAYALGNPEKRDSFAKECIDTLCEALSDHKDELMVIIAGYEKDLKHCFFAFNQGLDSRFTWRFKTDDYNNDELRKIFHKKVRDIGWKMEDENVPSLDWFKKNKEYFKYYGRDMETLLSKVKIAHSRRVFCLDDDVKRILTQKDIDLGFEKFLENDEVKNRKEDKSFYGRMYI